MNAETETAQEKPLLLIVDDDPLITDTLTISLAPHFDTVSSHARAPCTQMVRQLRRPPCLALVDLGLPPLPHRPDEGFALITDLLRIAPDLRIVILSGQNEEGNARHARALGAVDFVAKPCIPAELIAILQRALNFSPAASSVTSDSPLLGHSPAMQKLRSQLQQYANSPFPVLIEGESGSGKEIVARHCLHQDTQRKDKPFFALNCAAISPNLVEPTLFGHARGAFTGADSARAGYFEEADGGTLFLDEIGELPLELQAKLLRVLEDGEYQRVGETRTRVSKARIIAATNRDLRKEIKAGRFRADLYHRLSVLSVSVPPLREMDNDKLLLLDHFAQRYALAAGQPPFSLSAEAQQLWLSYAFPGNVRELRNIVIRLSARHSGEVVTASVLQNEFDLPDETPPPAIAASPATLSDSLTDGALARLRQDPAFSLDALLADTEQAYIEAALKIADGNVSHAARLLGINRTTLYNRMESFTRES